MKFPEHKCGLYLNHNEHKDVYLSLKDWLKNQDYIDAELTQSDRQECLRTDEFWELTWYPDTPVGSYTVAAPTLERLLERANES